MEQGGPRGSGGDGDGGRGAAAMGRRAGSGGDGDCWEAAGMGRMAGAAASGCGRGEERTSVGLGAEGLRGGRCGWEGGVSASWRVRGGDLQGVAAVLGTAGRLRGWDGWPGQRRVDVGRGRREGGSGGGGGEKKAYAISPMGISIFP